MKRVLSFLLLFIIAASAMAQSNSITLSAVQPQYSGVSAGTGGDSIPLGLRARTGYQIEAAHRFARTSLALSASHVSAPANSDEVGIGSIALTPIAATVAMHGGGDRFDPYIGVGAAYVMTGNLRSASLDALGFGTVSLGNDFTYLLKVGAAIRVAPSVAVKLDARYMPVSVSATAADSTTAHVRFNALTFAAGVQWSF